MLKEPAVPHRSNSIYLQHEYWEIIKEAYQAIHTSGLYKFTFAMIDSWWDDLNTVLCDLGSVPEATFKDLLEVIEGLTEARNELRLARFLFDVEDINPLYRLIMRNRAVLRGEHILRKVIRTWPSDLSYKGS